MTSLLCTAASARPLVSPDGKPRYSIVAHGGAGSGMPASARIYRRGLRRALQIGRRIL